VRELLRRVVARSAALADVFRSPELRRLELAWAGYYIAEWASFVAFSIYAYRVGGAAAVGLLGVVRMLPSALGVPAATALADRTRRERVLIGIHLSRAATLSAAAAALEADGPRWLIFTLAALTAVAGGAYRPAHLAIVPIHARTPQELVATNVSASTFEGLAVLVGPALAGVLLTFSDTYVVVAVSAGIALWAALLVSRIEPGQHVPPRGRGPIADLLAGARTLAKEPHPRLIIGLFASQALVRGLLNVLLVVAAFRLLKLHGSGFSFLNAAFGAGGLAGGVAGLGLIGLRRLAQPFAAGLVMWGVPLALLAAWPNAPWALGCLAVVGAGNAILDVSGFTLIQRAIHDAVLARVFGVFEVLVLTAVGIGSILGSVLVDQLGIRTALVVTGCILPVLATLYYRRLRVIDASADVPERELQLLSSIALFSALPATTLERIAMRLRPVAAATGTKLAREGEEGDLFYVIGSGLVDVSQHARHVATLGPGDYFGEIALLRDVPRVATCTARTDVELYTLEREQFVSAVSGNTMSAAEADAVMTQRLSELETPA
jgi:MFS family permease